MRSLVGARTSVVDFLPSCLSLQVMVLNLSAVAGCSLKSSDVAMDVCLCTCLESLSRLCLTLSICYKTTS